MATGSNRKENRKKKSGKRREGKQKWKKSFSPLTSLAWREAAPLIEILLPAPQSGPESTRGQSLSHISS